MYTHSTSVSKHVERMLSVPLSFGPDFHEVTFVEEAPKGSHMATAVCQRSLSVCARTFGLYDLDLSLVGMTITYEVQRGQKSIDCGNARD